MKYAFSILILLVPAIVSAQSNYKSGYVVTNTGDTVLGLINYKERLSNDNTISMKTESSAKPKEYSVNDAIAYGITGIESYERHLVNISQHTIDPSDLSIGIDSSYKTEKVFLKVIQKGDKVSLLSFRDNIKQRFYLQEGTQGSPYELVRQMFLDSLTQRKIVVNNRYQIQLLVLLRQHNPSFTEPEQFVQKVSYDEKELNKAVALINGNSVKKQEVSSFKYFVGAGLSVNSIFYTGSNDFNNGTESTKASLGPIVNLGFDILSNPAIGKLIFRIELTLSSSTNKIYASKTVNQSTRQISHGFTQLLATATPQLLYNFYNTERFKIFASAGLGLNLAKYVNNELLRINLADQLEVTNTGVKLEPYYFSVPLKAGLVFSKKYQVFAGYTFPAVISNASQYSLYSSKAFAGVNYLFGR